MGNYINHLKKIIKHKYYVGKMCFKFGLYWQGIVHDNSKFSPIEFFTSVKYYQGYRSPIDAEKEKKGYSLAWAHHHNKNPHHWLYWVDFDKQNRITPMRIPYKYAIEAIADWIGAGMAYEGKNFTWSEPYDYYRHNTRIGSDINIHPQTRQLWDTILVDIMKYGIDYTASLIKSKYYLRYYNNYKNPEGKCILYGLVAYNRLQREYYDISLDEYPDIMKKGDSKNV